MGSKADGFSQQLNGVVVALGVDEVLREVTRKRRMPWVLFEPLLEEPNGATLLPFGEPSHGGVVGQATRAREAFASSREGFERCVMAPELSE